MKRFAMIVLALLLCVGAASCGGKTSDETASSTESGSDAESVSEPSSEESSSEPEPDISALYEEAVAASDGQECKASFGVLFADGAILQRNTEVAVWGYAPDGERVFVTFGGQLKSAVAEDGVWSTALDPLEASAEPRELTLLCGGTATLSDILVGEVWIASGQSNMAFITDYLLGETGRDIRDDPDYNDIHMFVQDEATSKIALKEVKNGRWEQATKTNRGHFSTLGYLLGRDLYNELGVPVGIVMCAYGGTRIESFIAPKRQYAMKTPLYESYVTDCVYNAMIAPLAPYAVKGMIWYQGEANSVPLEYVQYYPTYVSALVTQMREVFGNADMPFIQVQLPSYSDAIFDFTEIRFAQQDCDSLIDGCYTVPAYDTGSATDIHPSDKLPIAARIRAVALSKVYGLDVPADFARLTAVSVSGAEATLTFSCGGALAVTLDKDGVAATLLACGADGVYVQAAAVPDGDNTLRITAPLADGDVIAGLKYVSQNWSKDAGLRDENEYPVMPFRWTENGVK